MAPTKIVLVLLWAALVRCWQATALVDSSDPRITYFDNERWYWMGSSSACVCTTSMGLDPSQLHNGTWRAALNTVYARFTFNGTGVNVFSAFKDSLGTLTNVTFVVDGQNQGSFVQYGQASDWKYKYRAFTASKLAEGEHELIIQGGSANLFVLDYMTITYTGKVAIVPIVGSVVGGLALLVVAVSFLFWRHLASRVPNSRDYSEAIRGLDGVDLSSGAVDPAGLVTIKMGEVRATHTAVVLTCFKGLGATRDVISARMTALVARNLKDGLHPFIIPIIGFAYLGDEACLISALVNTTELREYLANRQPAERRSLALDVAEGLQHLHKCGIVHSDLKPSNVVVNQDGRAMLRGYGAAGVAGRKAGKLYDPRYSAPEILDKVKFNFMSDVFSLGCVILFIMTGKAPYVHTQPDSAVALALLDGISVERSDYQECLGGDDDDTLWALLVRCWNPDPKQRPRMSEVVRTLFDQGDEAEEDDGKSSPEDGDESDADDTERSEKGSGFVNMRAILRSIARTVITP